MPPPMTISMRVSVKADIMLGIGLGSGLHPGEGGNSEQENSMEDVPLCYCPQVIGMDKVGL